MSEVQQDQLQPQAVWKYAPIEGATFNAQEFIDQFKTEKNDGTVEALETMLVAQFDAQRKADVMRGQCQGFQQAMRIVAQEFARKATK